MPTEGAERPVPTEPSAPSMQHDDGVREVPQVHDASRMSELDVSLDDSADADYVPSDSWSDSVDEGEQWRVAPRRSARIADMEGARGNELSG